MSIKKEVRGMAELREAKDAAKALDLKISRIIFDDYPTTKKECTVFVREIGSGSFGIRHPINEIGYKYIKTVIDDRKTEIEVGDNDKLTVVFTEQ